MKTTTVLPLAQSQNENQNQVDKTKQEVELLLQNFLTNCKELGLLIHPATMLSIRRDLFHTDVSHYQPFRLKKKIRFEKADCPALDKMRKNVDSLLQNQIQS